MIPDYEFVHEMHGVVASQNETGMWQLDPDGTSAKRAALRQARLDTSESIEDWWHSERKKVREKSFLPEVGVMYAQSLSFGKFNREFRGFWQLGDDYVLEES